MITALPVYFVNVESPQAPQYPNDPTLSPLQSVIDRAFKEINFTIQGKEARLINVKENMDRGSAAKVVAFLRNSSRAVLSWVAPKQSWRNDYAAKAEAGFKLPSLYCPGNRNKRLEWRRLNSEINDLKQLKEMLSDSTQLVNWIDVSKTRKLAAERIAENDAINQGENIGLEASPEADAMATVSAKAALVWGLRNAGIAI